MEVIWLGHPDGFSPSQTTDEVEVGEHFFIRIGGAVYRKVKIRHEGGDIFKQMEVTTGHIFDLTKSPVYVVKVKMEIGCPSPTGKAKQP